MFSLVLGGGVPDLPRDASLLAELHWSCGLGGPVVKTQASPNWCFGLVLWIFQLFSGTLFRFPTFFWVALPKNRSKPQKGFQLITRGDPNLR